MTVAAAGGLDDGIERREIRASQLGLMVAPTSKLRGGLPEDNARMTEAVLRGEPGIRRDVVVLNAGAALLVAGSVDTLEEGIERAALTIDAGLASSLLAALRAERVASERASAAEASAAPADVAHAGGGPERAANDRRGTS